MNQVAYSYVRFSTPGQKLGNSLARQLEAAQAYAANLGLTLDDSMRDEGLSGYHGRHVMKEGALGGFLKRVQAGEVAKGSLLIVEHLDRLSRQEPSVAQEQFLSIINRGVDIVTLIDGQRYSRGANMGQLFLSLGMMIGNHAESAKKAERTRDNWKRVRGTSSGLAPSWIRRLKNSDGTPAGFEVDQSKAAIVRRLFADVQTVGIDRLRKSACSRLT